MNVWDRVAQELRRYDSALIAARDATGYPMSVRCDPVPDRWTATFGVDLPAALGFEPGPAWLLCHFHNERYWSLRSFGARGSLERTAGGWRFRPRTFVAGVGSPVANARMFFGGRSRAFRYLAEHGITAPVVPWDRLNAVKREIAAAHAADAAHR